MFSADDVSALLSAALEYLRERELSSAAERLKAAMKVHGNTVYSGAREAVSATNCQLRAAKRDLDRIERAISSLPEDLRFDASHRLQPILDEFRCSVSELLIRKRALAGTARRRTDAGHRRRE